MRVVFAALSPSQAAGARLGSITSITGAPGSSVTPPPHRHCPLRISPPLSPQHTLQLLVDFIKCQEEIETILQQQEALLAELESAPDPAAAIQANLARSVAAQVPPCSSWATYMFAQATVGHIMFVRGMTMQDW